MGTFYKYQAVYFFVILLSVSVWCTNKKEKNIYQNEYVSLDTLGNDCKLIMNDGLVCAPLKTDFNDFLKNFSRYKIVELLDEDQVIIYKGRTPILSAGSPIHKKLYSINIYSNEYYTKEGLRVGMSLKDLIKIFGKMKLLFVPSIEESNSDEELFSPESYQTYSNGKQTIVFDIIVKSKSSNRVGIYKSPSNAYYSVTDEYDIENSFVDYIRIYMQE